MATASPPRAWQRMLSGRRLDLLDPSPLDIEIEDIAHGLARLARWNGQTQGPQAFSVAQHSLFVEAIAGEVLPKTEAGWQLSVLLHDAAEYVIGDIISPFKAVLASDYKAVELRLLLAIRRRFSLDPLPPQALNDLMKKADRIAAFHEATALAGFSIIEARKIFGNPPNMSRGALAWLEPMTADDAKNAFLKRFTELASVST
jgi:uncharacterized protein